MPIKGNNKISIDASADGESVEVKIDETGATEGQVLGVVNGAIAWKSLPELPTLAPVATSGSYTDLTNKPALKPVATSGSYNDLTDKPALKEVATTGNYNDLINKPMIPFVGDGTITIKQGDTVKGSFSVNGNTDKTIELDAGGGTVDTSNLAKLNTSNTFRINNTTNNKIKLDVNSSAETQISVTSEDNTRASRYGVYYPRIGVTNTSYNDSLYINPREGKTAFIRKFAGYFNLYTLPFTNTNDTTHNLLTDKTVKTIFGNQSIYTADGTGNIDLYKHHLTVNGYGYDFYGDFYSSKSLQCDSLTDLKSILGNSFKLQMYGAASTGALGSGWYMAMYLDENALHLAGSNGTNSIQYDNLTIADEITTI